MDVTFTDYEQLAGVSEGIVASVSERFKYDRETGKRTEQYEGAMIVTVSPVKGYEQIRTLVPGKPVTLTAEAIEAAYKRGKVYKVRFSGFSARFYADRSNKVAVSSTAEDVEFREADFFEPEGLGFSDIEEIDIGGLK